MHASSCECIQLCGIRIAVEEWIESKYPIHILRDHVNHCIVMNGGMWGGTKDAIASMSAKVAAWSSRDEYMADLHFLDKQIWPEIKNSQIAHDSYCCDRFPNARPFPTQRDMLVICMYVCVCSC